MKQNLVKIFGIIALLVILLLIILYKPWKINDVEYEEFNYVLDRTGNEVYVDILHLGLNYLDIKETAIIVKPMSGQRDINSDIHIKAFIIGNTDQFKILTNLKNSNIIEVIEVLSHELIHLKQYNDGTLIDENGMIIFNDTVYFKNMLPTYFERPWEVQAFEQQKELAIHIRDNLLSK